MSQENVELAQQCYEAVNRRDFDAVGHEGFRRWVADSFESFEEIRNEWSEFRDLGDRVLALGHVKARGRGSGMALDSPMGWVFTVRRGKVLKAEGFLSRGEALEAVGLSEQDVSGA